MNAPVSGSVFAARTTLPPPPHREAWLEDAKRLVGDLYQRSPLIYWTDFLCSITAAWAATAVYFTASPWSVLQIAAFLLASVLFFRAGTFIHEIIHMPPRQMVGFKRVWNLLQGIPLLMPWVLYRNHVDHHSAQHFGSPDDGEYLPLAAAPLKETLKYLAQAPLLPAFVIIRFGVLSPLSWCHRGLREWVLTTASAAVSNPYYRKRFPARDERHLLIVEVLCFVYLLTIAALVYIHVISLTQLMMGYTLLAFALGLNLIRNLAAHRYDNPGERMSHAEQFSNSINITGINLFSILMFPVGLRYHALHHLFPSIPYHRLGEAHRRLSQQLPADAPYHATGRESFFAAMADLLRAARQTPDEQSAMARWQDSIADSGMKDLRQ